ncbi:MAG: hypothetical protein KF911_04375 [Pseudomonadales bacterium]|nr:hypothetical protein [Pseudomonadales bacterium]
MPHVWAILGGLLIGILLTGTARAGTAHDVDRAFQVTPYVWATGFGGTIRPFTGAPDFEVSKSFGELLEDLDAALFLTGLARQDRFVAVADFSHTSSSRDGRVPTPIPGVPVVPAEGELKQTSLTLLGGYRAVDEPDLSLDLLAGARAFWIRGSVAAPALGVVRSPTEDFVDPIVAGRVNARIAEGWSVLFYGDYGGFGVGSERTTQWLATVNTDVSPHIWISGGYRQLNVDYRERGMRVDARLGGPILGVTILF